MAKKVKLSLDDLYTGNTGLKESVVNTVKNLEEKRNTKENDRTEPRSYKRILYSKIYSSPLNDYPIEGLEETETLLLKYGLLEPFSVNYDEDTDMYELESGDRRFHSLKNLFQRFENDSLTNISATSDMMSPEQTLYMKNIHGLYTDGIYCMVENGARDRDSVRARIIIHNESSRSFDAMRTASKINELSQIYTRQNEHLPKGERINVNQKIEEELKGRYTVRQIIRYKNFDKLTDELKKVIIDHNMSIAEISTYHTMTAEEQSVLAQYINEYHTVGTKLKLPSKEELKAIIESTFPQNTTPKIDEAEEQYDVNAPTENTQETPSVSQEPSDALTVTSTYSDPEENKSDYKINDIDAALQKKAHIEALKATAVQKIQQVKNKKDSKINDTVNSLQKKAHQLEKAIFSYIAEEDSELKIDLTNLVNDINSTIDTLTSIKTTLERE